MDQLNPINQHQRSKQPNLPELPEGLKSALERGHTLPIEGTNVIRVPFGVRQSRRARPERPERWATLVLPLHSIDSPTPPPAAA